MRWVAEWTRPVSDTRTKHARNTHETLTARFTHGLPGARLLLTNRHHGEAEASNAPLDHSEMTHMRKLLLLVALTLTAIAIVPVAAMAATPIDTVKADLTKLSTDVQTKHDAVVADAQKLQADATSFLGTSDKKAARAAIKADALKLTTDWHSLLAVCLADRAQLHQDIAAARAAGAGGDGQLRLLVRQANLTIRATNLEMRAAVARARAAVVGLRASFKAAGQQAPVVPLPPATP
jgi:hypothetical protein